MSDKKIVLKVLKTHKTIWHPESRLVFKARNDRVVIGSLDSEKKNILPMDEESIALCESWGFKPDESLLEDDDGEAGEHEGQETERPQDDESEKQESEEESEKESDDQKQESEEESDDQKQESETQEDDQKQESETQEDDQKQESETQEVESCNEKEWAIVRKLQQQVESRMNNLEVINRQKIKKLTEEKEEIERKINEVIKEKEETELRIKQVVKEREQFEKNYETLKNKFDTMKSLFN